jgi:hypothetical protein
VVAGRLTSAEMFTESPPEVEDRPTPAVSSLRSKFEKLAVESSSTTSLNKITMSHDLLSPDSGSPRPRAMSISTEQRPPSSPRSLRSAASSSDLKKKPPPPPPPARSSKGNSPAPSVTSSPLIRAVPMSSGPPSPTSIASPLSKAALLQRKPPLPPSSPAALSQDLPQTPGGSGVASLLNKFG